MGPVLPTDNQELFCMCDVEEVCHKMSNNLKWNPSTWTDLSANFLERGIILTGTKEFMKLPHMHYLRRAEVKK